jgi:hypothetical protein
MASWTMDERAQRCTWYLTFSLTTLSSVPGNRWTRAGKSGGVMVWEGKAPNEKLPPATPASGCEMLHTILNQACQPAHKRLTLGGVPAVAFGFLDGGRVHSADGHVKVVHERVDEAGEGLAWKARQAMSHAWKRYGECSDARHGPQAQEHRHQTHIYCGRQCGTSRQARRSLDSAALTAP